MKYLNIYDINQKNNSNSASAVFSHTNNDVFLQKIERIIEANIGNEKLCVTMLAMKVHLSVSQLNRKLKELTGQPAGQLIRSNRMKYAAQLLANDAASVGEIADKVGYLNQTHFCRSFKREFGRSPFRFSKENRPRHRVFKNIKNIQIIY